MADEMRLGVLFANWLTDFREAYTEDFKPNLFLSSVEITNKNYILFLIRGEKIYGLFMGQWVYQLVWARIFQRLIRNPGRIPIHCFAPIRIQN